MQNKLAKKLKIVSLTFIVFVIISHSYANASTIDVLGVMDKESQPTGLGEMNINTLKRIEEDIPIVKNSSHLVNNEEGDLTGIRDGFTNTYFKINHDPITKGDVQNELLKYKALGGYETYEESLKAQSPSYLPFAVLLGMIFLVGYLQSNSFQMHLFYRKMKQQLNDK